MRMMVLSWCHAWINVPMCLWNFFSWQYEIRQRLDLALNYFLLAIDLRDSFWTFIRELNLGSQSSCYSMQQLIWEFLRGSCIVLQIISLLLSLSFYMCTEIHKTWPNHSSFFWLRSHWCSNDETSNAFVLFWLCLPKEKLWLQLATLYMKIAILLLFGRKCWDEQGLYNVVGRYCRYTSDCITCLPLGFVSWINHPIVL